MNAEPITLQGRHVRLAPLETRHADALWAIAEDPAIWRWMPFEVRDEGGFHAWLDNAISGTIGGMSHAFVTLSADGAEAYGSTSFLAMNPPNRRLEIGNTWIAPAFQRSIVNTEAKYLQLQHCFETLGCLRVEFKTHHLNEKSRRAIARLGAIEEGTFRKHMIMPDGTRRDSVWFSITDDQWPEVKAKLAERLQRV